MGIYRSSPRPRQRDLPARNIYVDGNLYSAGSPPHPALRYNESTLKWQFSNDGVNFNNMSSGSIGGGDAAKIAELVYTPIMAGISHTIPGGLSYEVTMSGDKLDIFMNGQLLTPRSNGGETGDYTEINTTTIQFNIDVPENSALTYIIKQS